MPAIDFRRLNKTTEYHTFSIDRKNKKNKLSQYPRLLARKPGLHSGNIRQQQTADAVAGLLGDMIRLSIITNVINSPHQTVTGKESSLSPVAGTMIPATAIKNHTDNNNERQASFSSGFGTRWTHGNLAGAETHWHRTSRRGSATATTAGGRKKSAGSTFTQVPGRKRKRIKRSPQLHITTQQPEKIKISSSASPERAASPERINGDSAEVIKQSKAEVAGAAKKVTSGTVAPLATVLPASDKLQSKQIIDRLRKHLLAITKEDIPGEKEALLADIAELLHKKQHPSPDEYRHLHLERIAKMIMVREGRYMEEDLTTNKAVKYIRDWMVKEILGATPEVYFSQLLEEERKKNKELTVEKLLTALSFSKVKVITKIDTGLLTKKRQKVLRLFWQDATENILPFIPAFEKDREILSLPVSNFDFAAFYTAVRLIKDSGGDLNKFSKEFLFQSGFRQWDSIVEGVIVDENSLDRFAMPACWYYQAEGKGINCAEKKELDYADKLRIVQEYSQVRKEKIDELLELESHLLKFQQAMKERKSRGELAEKIIKSCEKTPSRERRFVYINPYTPEDLKKQNYMNGITRPCKSAPDLEEAYKNQTAYIADTFADLINKPITTTLHQHGDAEFIFAQNATLQPVSAVMTVTESLAFNSMAGQFHVPYRKSVQIKNSAVLFSAKAQGEERIYALKTKTEGSYELLRVDREKINYLKHDLLDYARKINNNGWVIDEVKISPGAEKFIIGDEGEKEKFINCLKISFRDKFYDTVYKMGDDLSDLQKIWKVTKSLIPFYDCIAGIANGESEQAVFDCTFDLVSTITDISGAVRGAHRSVRYGLKQAKLLSEKNSIRHIINPEGSFPAKEQIKNYKLLTPDTKISSPDKTGKAPAETGTGIIKKVNNLEDRLLADHIARIEKAIPTQKQYMEKLRSGLEQGNAKLTGKPYVIAHFRGGKTSLLVRVIDFIDRKKLCVMINPDSGKPFGKIYQLTEKNILEPLPTYLHQRITSLRQAGLTGKNLRPAQVIAKVLYSDDEQKAIELLSKYHFPTESILYTENNFALAIKETGKIPGWAEDFKLLDFSSYVPPYKSSVLLDNGLYMFKGGNGFAYRVDFNPPEVILTRGFPASQDYTAIEKMLPEGVDGLIAAETLTGALRYQTLVNGKKTWIYKIDLNEISGVSAQDNWMRNGDNFKAFLDGEPVKKEGLSGNPWLTQAALAEDCNGASCLMEMHLVNSDIKPSAISLVTPEELQQAGSLESGPWKNYFKRR